MPLTCISSIIALVLMLLGIILRLINVELFGLRPHMYYFSAINFILFAIVFHLAGTSSDQAKK